MRRLIAMLLVVLMLSGCGAKTEAPEAPAETKTPEAPVQLVPEDKEIAFESRFKNETLIELSDEGIKTKALSVFASNDII